MIITPHFSESWRRLWRRRDGRSEEKRSPKRARETEAEQGPLFQLFGLGYRLDT
jgi:transposase-like protein